MSADRPGRQNARRFRKDGLRFFFFSNEGSPREVPHVHVPGGGRDTEIWL
jgi:hypothetical protein